MYFVKRNKNFNRYRSKLNFERCELRTCMIKTIFMLGANKPDVLEVVALSLKPEGWAPSPRWGSRPWPKQGLNNERD